MRETEILSPGEMKCHARHTPGRFVRLCLILIGGMVLLTSSGCPSMILWRRKDPQLSKITPPLAPNATPEEILARVNENAYSPNSPDGLKSYRDDRVQVRMKGVPAPMRASMVVEAPRNLRLRVAHPLSGGEAVDIGSNDQEFWFWGKESRPANVLVCSHDEIAAATQVTSLPLPFRPDWLMEVLGVVPISGSKYEIRRANPKSPIVELVSVQRTPDQQPVRRIVKVDLPHGVVLEHRVESMEGQMIAKAVLARHFRDPQTRLILPRQISIDWPAAEQQVSLSLEFNQVEFNSPAEGLAMWEVPQMDGFPEFNIGEYAMRQLGRSREEIAPPATEEGAVAGRAKLADDAETLEAPPAAGSGSDDAQPEIAQGNSWKDPQSLDTIQRPVRTASSRDERDAIPDPSGNDASSDPPADRVDPEPATEHQPANARPFPRGL